MDDALFIEIQQLFRLVRQRGLRELSLTRPGFSISVNAESAVTDLPVAVPHIMPAPVHPVPEEPQVAARPQGFELVSPLVGTFYRTPSPDAPAFVEVGDVVEAGQTVCIVEAMKVFNEIVSDHAGTILAIHAQNGQLVHAEETLMVIDIEE